MEARTLATRPGAMLLATGLAVGAAACAGTSRAESPYEASAGPEEAVIVVDNRSSSVTEMTVYLVPANGVRNRLGTVTLNDRRSFEVTEANWGSEFRLLGDPAGSSRFSSPAFVLTRGNVLEWDVDLNRVHFGGSAGGG